MIRASNISLLQALRIFNNPYCLCEEYVGQDVDDTIGFQRIDHGMIPSQELGKGMTQIALDDPRRLRALMTQFLKSAADAGHTFLERSDLFAVVEQWHKENDPAGHFILDKAIWEQHREIFSKKLMLDSVEGVEAIFLNPVHASERVIRKEILELMSEEKLPASGID